MLRLRTLRDRVALTSALSAAVSGAIVATTVVLLAERVTTEQEDAHLRDAAGVLAYELQTESEDPAFLAEDEQRELAEAGIQIAIFAGEIRLGGSKALHAQAAGTCTEQGALRSCARAAGKLTIVAGRDAGQLHDHRSATLVSAAIAATIATLLGALTSLLVARRVVKPLELLRRRVELVPIDDPGNADLGPRAGVDEVDSLRASLSTALARLGGAMMQAQRFASDAAHELRTPLTAILGALELAIERTNPDASGELLRAQRVAQRLTGLVDRLLILARSQTRIDKAEAIDLLDLFEDAIDTFPPEQRARIQLAAKSTPIHGDPLLVLAMLTNALDNSLKFSRGAVQAQVNVHGSEVVISIEDDGPGIPVAERARVFAPFYRTRASRASDVPGHGIGLALIAHVSALHGGTARFAERAGGARLELILPANGAKDLGAA